VTWLNFLIASPVIVAGFVYEWTVAAFNIGREIYKVISETK
jgi:hypothetical protein